MTSLEPRAARRLADRHLLRRSRNRVRRSGPRRRRLWLIDWDFAGFNTPLFDLANLATNNGLTPDLEATLLEGYFDGPVDADLCRGFDALKCASLLREALWGAVSRLTSEIDFDYLGYAREHAMRFDRQWVAFQADRR